MPGLDYDLHKLGWRAFQDLCAIVLQQVLGQTFHTFADSNDGGRDGAFQGPWSPPRQGGEAADGMVAGDHTVAQCKFRSTPSDTLSPTDLRDELAKVRRLKRKGLCDAYVLLTNARVTGRTDEWLRSELGKLGVGRCLVLDGTWVCQQISTRPDLRRYVPRVYGLGDLSLILDDRRIQQARALLGRLSGDLATFVPSGVYRQAADALAGHGFVLLLGEPASGKSTIAATLAMAALDNWGSAVQRVDSADELIAAWAPSESNQLFWVDDVFGSIRHDAALTDSWARRMDQVTAAITSGAKIILTSRDYIYRDAVPHLKVYHYPLLKRQQVVVDVTELTQQERRQILYNHLKAGDQPSKLLATWQPHLPAAAAVERFQPEVARRLSHRAFTKNVSLDSEYQLVRYFEQPTSFLMDILGQLSRSDRAAMACVYLSGDELPAPVEFTPTLIDAVHRLGSSEPDVLRSFQSLIGTFLQQAADPRGDAVWRFRHPTIREAFASLVATDPNAVGVFIDGLTDAELLAQLDCGGADTRGVLIRVPTSLYDRILPRIRLPLGRSHMNATSNFLQNRTSPKFLQRWSAYHAASLATLLNFSAYLDAFWQPGVLGALAEADALPESVRRRAAQKVAEQAIDVFDAGWLSEPICHILTDTERDRLLDEIVRRVVPNLDEYIDQSADGYEKDVPPEERFEVAMASVDAYYEIFAGDPVLEARFRRAQTHIQELINEAEEGFVPARSEALAATPPSRGPATGRSEFDDLADGRPSR